MVRLFLAANQVAAAGGGKNVTCFFVSSPCVPTSSPSVSLKHVLYGDDSTAHSVR